jgi:glycosyltransferase involved in cell wall biosynthesis
MKPSVVILSFNSADSISGTLERALTLSDDVFVVDSFSSDATVSIAEALGARVVQHPFEDYSAQRNWAIDSLPFRYSWQVHLDSDEWMDSTLVQAIRDLPDDTSRAGFLIPRYVRFLGRVLKHGGMSPTWHLRLFRAGAARCEMRRYDQHFCLNHGTVGRLRGCMIDDIRMPLSEWTARHNRWSDAEIDEMINHRSTTGRIQAKAFGNPIEQKRYWRSRYDQLPLFVRPFALFLYRYCFRLGFLDGREGLIFWTLQTFWFRFLIDAKLFQLRNIPSPLQVASGSAATLVETQSAPTR